MDRTYIEKETQLYLERKETTHLWRIASHADILDDLNPNGKLTPNQQGKILLWLAQNGFLTTPNSQLSPYAQKIEAITKTAIQKGIGLERIAQAIDKTEELNDGTKEFWLENPELLDATADWEISYSDMGYTEPPQF